MASRASLSTAEVIRATAAAAKAGLHLVAVEKKPDGTIRVEFGENKPDNDDFWTGSPLFEERT
jgi:hypothetical protein